MRMEMDETILSMSKTLNGGSIGTATVEFVRAKREGTSEFQLSRGTGPVSLDRGIHGPKIIHNLVSISGLCNDGHTVQLTKNSCVIKLKREFVFIDRRTDWMYAVDSRRVRKQRALTARRKELHCS